MNEFAYLYEQEKNHVRGQELARAYSREGVSGWLGRTRPELLAAQFKVLGSEPDVLCPQHVRIPRFRLLHQTRPTAGRKAMLYLLCRQVLGKDTPNYPQEIGDPFAPGTMVLMADGTEKKIEDICLGDVVINHKNEPARVHRLIKKQFTGRMITVHLQGWHRPLTATETHHGFIVPEGDRNTIQRDVKFGDLKVGDLLLTSYGRELNEEVTLDLTQLVDCSRTDDTYVYRRGKAYSRFIKVDETFAWLIGIYLAEGGRSANGITFSLNAQETDLMDRIQRSVFKVFGLPCVIQKTGVESCRRVAINSTFIRDFFTQFVPGNLYSKRIPSVFFRVNRAIRKALLRGWYDGDGYLNFKRNAVIGYTSSDNLGTDMLRMTTLCRLNARSWRRMRKTRSSVPNTEVALYSGEPYELYPDNWTGTQIKTRRKIRTRNGILRPIVKIEEEFVENKTVYCITTENELTAIFNGVSSQNCVSFGGKNAAEYLSCTQILQGTRQKWTPVFPPYYYHTSRMKAGNGQIPPNEDGSLGSWLAESAQEWGTLFSSSDGVPPYSGQIAKKWGGTRDIGSGFYQIGKDHLVRSVAQIRSWDDLVAAIVNGYPCTTASNVGYSMEPGSDGFHAQTDNWGHQLCCHPETMINAIIPQEIQFLVAGDRVYGKDGKLHTVSQVFKRHYAGKMVKISCYGAQPLVVTPNHPVLVSRNETGNIETYHTLDLENCKSVLTQRTKRWVNAEDLQKGDLLISPDVQAEDQSVIPDWPNYESEKTQLTHDDEGVLRPVRKIEMIDYEGLVYNLEVEDSHTYIANGMVVHNCFIGVNDNDRDPYAVILNSWADAHGHLKDFDDGHDLPIGVLRVRRRDAEKHIRAGETYAWSQFNGMVEQDLDRLLFKVVGS